MEAEKFIVKLKLLLVWSKEGATVEQSWPAKRQKRVDSKAPTFQISRKSRVKIRVKRGMANIQHEKAKNTSQSKVDPRRYLTYRWWSPDLFREPQGESGPNDGICVQCKLLPPYHNTRGRERTVAPGYQGPTLAALMHTRQPCGL